tara:strand:- start:1815 stop:2858 length:1044 start_codon:yes stop_codon:yes gene_type:complete
MIKKINITINEIFKDLNDINKINKKRKAGIAQKLRRETLKYMVKNKTIDDLNINTNIKLFNELLNIKVNNLYDFFKLKINNYFDPITNNISISSRKNIQLNLIAKDFINLYTKNNYSNFILNIHGSQADGETTNYSDIDISLFIKVCAFENTEKTNQTFLEIDSINRLMNYWDKSSHHSAFINLETDFKCYPEAFMPISVLKLGIMPKNNLIQIQSTRDGLDLLFENYFNILKIIITIINQKKYFNTIVLKQLLSSYFMLLILEFQIKEREYLDKKSIFKKINKNNSHFDLLNILSKIREKWPTNNFSPNVGISDSLILKIMKQIERMTNNIQSPNLLKEIKLKYFL